METTPFSIRKFKHLDLQISSILFLLSFSTSLYYPNIFSGIIILLSFGFVVYSLFIKPDKFSITEHFLVAFGIGLLTTNILMAVLINFDKILFYKEILFISFLIFITLSLLKRKKTEYTEYYFNKDDLYPWILVILFFLISVLLRHADFRLPDEYMYLNKFESIINGGYITTYAQDRYFFHYTYSTILEFAHVSFRSIEILSLCFASLSIISTYLLGKELFDKNVGYLGAVFLAFNPSFIFYSIRLLPSVISVFLITTFLYFFYKWYIGKDYRDFIISCIFIIITVFVKLHGIIFLVLGAIYILIPLNRKDIKKNMLYGAIFISAILVFSITWHLHGDLMLMLQRMMNDLGNDIVMTGYKIYITFFSPDLYTMPFVVLFVAGVAASFKETTFKKLFIFLPIIVYMLFISLTRYPFGTGVRNFLVIIPLLSVLAAHGLINREKINRTFFLALISIYVIILALMIHFAQMVPHLSFIIPDLPLWIKVLTFGSALIIVILVTIKPDREKWQTVGKIIIFLVIFSSLLNAIFFIYWQVEYPDRSQNGIVEASKWLNENTPANATIQSSIWELPGWININKPLHPEMKYPRSTFLSHYVYRTTYAPPGNEKDFLTRIENKEIDYIVIFTDPTLTSSEHAKNIYDYLQNYVDEAPAGSELIYSEFKNQKVLFRIYKVL